MLKARIKVVDLVRPVLPDKEVLSRDNLQHLQSHQYLLQRLQARFLELALERNDERGDYAFTSGVIHGARQMLDTFDAALSEMARARDES